MTNTAITPFFSSEQRKAAIHNFYLLISNMEPLPSPYPEVVEPLRTFFSVLEGSAEAFDEYCKINIEWIGEHFVRQIQSFDRRGEQASENLVDIFVMAYRFLCELDFSQPGDLSFELRSVKSFAEEKLDLFQGANRRQMVYANYSMPIQMLKRLVQDPSLFHFRAFADSATAATKLKADWDKELEQKTNETNALRDSINQIKTQYNFVGLVKGFESLAEKKKLQRRTTFQSLFAIGFAMILLISGQLGYNLYHLDEIEKHRAMLFYSVPAVFALEIVLLYFFRILLVNHRSFQTQLLQLELRISLCQFIQSYAEYASKIKKQDASALEKFESLVFSSVISDSEKLPATFDGVEQLAKFVKSLRVAG
jgi:hypothetical protein